MPFSRFTAPCTGDIEDIFVVSARERGVADETQSFIDRRWRDLLAYLQLGVLKSHQRHYGARRQRWDHQTTVSVILRRPTKWTKEGMVYMDRLPLRWPSGIMTVLRVVRIVLYIYEHILICLLLDHGVAPQKNRSHDTFTVVSFSLSLLLSAAKTDSREYPPRPHVW